MTDDLTYPDVVQWAVPFFIAAIVIGSFLRDGAWTAGDVELTGTIFNYQVTTTITYVGGEIAAQIQEEAFDYLDAPIRRVCGADVPVPASPLSPWLSFLPEVGEA